MKKKYEKPAVYIETFNLSQSIAAGCGAMAGGSSLGKPAHWTKETCGWDMGNGAIWLLESGVCTLPGPVDGEIGGVCYNNPSGGSSIFGSY